MTATVSVEFPDRLKDVLRGADDDGVLLVNLSVKRQTSHLIGLWAERRSPAVAVVRTHVKASAVLALLPGRLLGVAPLLVRVAMTEGKSRCSKVAVYFHGADFELFPDLASPETPIFLARIGNDTEAEVALRIAGLIRDALIDSD